MRIWLNDNARKDYVGRSRPNPQLFGEWIGRGVWYRDRKTLDVNRGMEKLDRLVVSHQLHGKPIGIDIENQPVRELVEVADAIAQRWPYLRYGFFARTRPKPSPTNDEWAELEPYVALTWSQGLQNRESLEAWTVSIVDQAEAWAKHFPGQTRALFLRPTPHPVAIRRGWFPPGILEMDTWRRMLAIAAKHYDLGIVASGGQQWDANSEWYRALSEIDNKLEASETEF